MNVAIIGAGNVGSALASSITRAGHQVTITAASRDSAQQVAQQVGGQVVGTNREAVEGAEVVILAVPTQNLDEVLSELDGTLDGKVVVDVTNRVDPEEPGSVLDGTSNAERIRERAPGARVVKAFNTAFASRQADPVVEGAPADGFLAGDDAQAKERVSELIRSIGFRPIDAGPLVMARALEGMGTLLITLNMANNWSWQNAWKIVGPLEG
jgi:8-hydroxy-5-deazaflavin:NADPH oxidoreductase